MNYEPPNVSYLGVHQDGISPNAIPAVVAGGAKVAKAATNVAKTASVATAARQATQANNAFNAGLTSIQAQGGGLA